MDIHKRVVEKYIFFKKAFEKISNKNLIKIKKRGQPHAGGSILGNDAGGDARGGIGLGGGNGGDLGGGVDWGNGGGLGDGAVDDDKVNQRWS